LGCCARPSEKVLPPSMASASSPMIFLLFQHPQPAQQRQTRVHERGQLPGERGQHFRFHPAAQPGDSDVEVDLPLLGAAFGGFAGFAGPLGLSVRLVPDLVDFDDFGGEKPHFLHPPDGLVLAGDLEGAFGLLAPRIHRHVIVLRHSLLSLDPESARGHVYFTISSMVVSPSKMPRKPSSRKVTMPSSTAFCRSTTVGARSLISARIASLTVNSSKIPFRPR
jgi:hypothetical protein